MSNWWGLLKKPQKQSKPGVVDGKVKLPKLAGTGDIDSVIDEHEAAAAAAEAEAEAERQAYREAMEDERAAERAQRHEEERYIGDYCGC